MKKKLILDEGIRNVPFGVEDNARVAVDPVWYQAIKDSEERDKNVERDMEEINKSIEEFLKWQNENVNVDNTEIPKSETLKKMKLQEALFVESGNFADAFTPEQVRAMLEEDTDNFQKERGVISTAYEEEKDVAVRILKYFYENVEVSDGRRTKDEPMSWVIAFNKPFSAEKKRIEERLEVEEADFNDVDTLADAIGSAVKALLADRENDGATDCYCFPLDDKAAVYVGWSELNEKEKELSGSNAERAIAIGLKQYGNDVDDGASYDDLWDLGDDERSAEIFAYSKTNYAEEAKYLLGQYENLTKRLEKQGYYLDGERKIRPIEKDRVVHPKEDFGVVPDDEGLDEALNEWIFKTHYDADGNPISRKDALKKEVIYALNSYYDDRFRGLEDGMQTKDFEEAKEWAWEKLQDGYPIKFRNDIKRKVEFIVPDSVENYGDLENKVAALLGESLKEESKKDVSESLQKPKTIRVRSTKKN